MLADLWGMIVSGAVMVIWGALVLFHPDPAYRGALGFIPLAFSIAAFCVGFIRVRGRKP